MENSKTFLKKEQNGTIVTGADTLMANCRAIPILSPKQQSGIGRYISKADYKEKMVVYLCLLSYDDIKIFQVQKLKRSIT